MCYSITRFGETILIPVAPTEISDSSVSLSASHRSDSWVRRNAVYEVKLSLCIIKHYATKAYGRVDV
jgi:hypothetical protein